MLFWFLYIWLFGSKKKKKERNLKTNVPWNFQKITVYLTVFSLSINLPLTKSIAQLYWNWKSKATKKKHWAIEISLYFNFGWELKRKNNKWIWYFCKLSQVYISFQSFLSDVIASYHLRKIFIFDRHTWKKKMSYSTWTIQNTILYLNKKLWYWIQKSYTLHTCFLFSMKQNEWRNQTIGGRIACIFSIYFIRFTDSIVFSVITKWFSHGY